MEETILLVDDDPALLEVTSIVLASEGYKVLTAEDGTGALRVVGQERLDLVVLDVMLPKTSGFEVLKKIRQQTDVPVVMLTAKSHSVDKVVGLELGADDYITKPFDTKELLARIRAILRRLRQQNGRGGVLKLGPLELDPRRLHRNAGRRTPGPHADGVQNSGAPYPAARPGIYPGPDIRRRFHQLALPGEPLHRRAYLPGSATK